MKYYKVTDGDCLAISLVEEPAIESDFIALSKLKMAIKLENEKRLLIGAVLIPNKPIYRCDSMGEYYISFDEPTIERLALNFLANYNQYNITVDHEREVADVVVVESWIKTSEEDKSNAYGLNEPVGTWFIAVKVNNDEIWEGVKNGSYKGFSIEAIVGLDELINTNNLELSMDKELKELIEKLKDMLNSVLPKKDEDSKKEEVKEEEVKEEVKEEEVKAEEVDQLKAKDEEIAKLTEDVANLTAEVERIKSERDELESKLKDLETKNEEINADLEKAKAENVKLSKQPSVKPVVKQNDGKNYSAVVKFQSK